MIKHPLLRPMNFILLIALVLPSNALTQLVHDTETQQGGTGSEASHVFTTSLRISNLVPQPDLVASTLSTSTVYLPLVLNNYQPLPPIIPATTEVLTNQTTQYLAAVSSDGAVFTFTQSTAELRNLAPGDAMIGGVSAAAPYGFLRKVTTVTTVGGQTVVQTTAATLEDALQQGEAHVNQTLTPSQIQSARYNSGVTLSPNSLTPQATTFYLEIKDVVLYDDDGNLSTTNDQVLANGSIEVEPTLNFDLRVKDWQLEQLRFTIASREKVEVKIEAKLTSAQLKREKELARYFLTPITAFVGPVPVVMTPILTFVVGVDGDVHISLSVGVTQQATLTGGLQYSGGNWGPISQYSNAFQFQPPTLSLGGDLKGFAGPRFQVLLYGIAGPQIKLDGYVKLEANTAETPWWRLFGGLQVSAEFRMEVLSHKIASYEIPEVIGVKWLLAQADSSVVSVPGNTLWLDTGITATTGQTLTISATGTVFTIVGNDGSKSGPEGQQYVCPDTVNSPTDCALNGAPYGALIGRIGQDGIPFKVGAHLEITASSTGTLYLVVNDNLIYYSDNAGSYDVFVTLR